MSSNGNKTLLFFGNKKQFMKIKKKHFLFIFFKTMDKILRDMF